MQHFTFICSIAEVNAVQSQAWGRGEATMPQLQFCQKLAKQMLTNIINVQVVPEIVPVHTRHQRNIQHQCIRWGIHNGTWNLHTHRVNQVELDYVRHQCTTCGAKKDRHYCSCDPATPLCIGCHAIHANAIN
jgi:hypothetical protein